MAAERESDARPTGSAAVARLRRALEDAESHARWAADDVASAERRMQEAQAEADELRQAILKLQGGDGHEG